MKLSFHGLSLGCGFVVGILIAICVSPLLKRNDMETDTTTVEVVKQYSRFDLQAKTIKLDIPKIGTIPELVFVPEEKVSVVVRDSVSYIVMDREQYYTETDDARIWHSGVESRIDSLMVISKKETTTYREKQRKNSLTLFGEIAYDNVRPSLPVGLQYTYHLNRWIGLGGGVQYDMFQHNMAVFAKLNFTIEW